MRFVKFHFLREIIFIPRSNNKNLENLWYSEDEINLFKINYYKSLQEKNNKIDIKNVSILSLKIDQD